MKASRFVYGSSLILAGWLLVTFFNKVPHQRYPKLDKTTETALSVEETATAPEMTPAPKVEISATVTR